MFSKEFLIVEYHHP